MQKYVISNLWAFKNSVVQQENGLFLVFLGGQDITLYTAYQRQNKLKGLLLLSPTVVFEFPGLFLVDTSLIWYFQCLFFF